MTNYSGAINHYKKLKETMINRLLNDSQFKELTKKQLGDMIVNEGNNISDSKTRMQRTEKVFSALENALLDDPSKYQKLISQCIQAQTQSNNQALEESKLALKNLLAENQTEILNRTTFTDELIQNISASDYNTVFGQMKAILVNSLIFNKKLTLYTNSAIRIGGFIQEVMELQSLREFFERPNSKKAIINTYLTSDKTITLSSGKKVESPMDLVISAFNNVEEAFNDAVNNSKNVDQYLSGDIPYSNVKSFGVQSKSWNITSTLRFYEIGHRTGLLNSFKSKYPRSYYKIEKAIEFLSQTNNTLEALGPMNVLFRTGNQRFWMDEFLEGVTKNMQLIFASQKKNYYNPSEIVGFSQVYINYKNIKNIQRKQYRNHKR